MGQRGGKREGAGRPPGALNKMNSDIKGMILEALNMAGGADYLMQQSKANPSAFMVLVGKVLPLQLTGANGGPVEMIVTGVRRAIEDDDQVGEQLAIESGVARDDDEVAE